jgi:hypothetical protein
VLPFVMRGVLLALVFAMLFIWCAAIAPFAPCCESLFEVTVPDCIAPLPPFTWLEDVEWLALDKDECCDCCECEGGVLCVLDLLPFDRGL